MIYEARSQWWRHQMGTFSALLDLCAGSSPVTGKFPTQMSVSRSFKVFWICIWINGWVNNREADDLRRHRAHYDVTVKCIVFSYKTSVLLNPRSLIYKFKFWKIKSYNYKSTSQSFALGDWNVTASMQNVTSQCNFQLCICLKSLIFKCVTCAFCFYKWFCTLALQLSLPLTRKASWVIHSFLVKGPFWPSGKSTNTSLTWVF